ncbi:hypothetical protein TNCT_174831 [Trichonephila clavata]|uniref:Uncharacterized protein n=1 Tax=Trichonephila clavata TaxID=2740835 RepID=A0A8X6EZV8_TRICU|nr:hypothetical protein TNCT_174831 [Trichonephila clavata]
MTRANERADHVTVTSGPPGKKKVYLQKTSSHSKNGRGQVKQVVACVLTSFHNPCALRKRNNSTGQQRTPWPMPSERWVSTPFPDPSFPTSAVPLSNGHRGMGPVLECARCLWPTCGYLWQFQIRTCTGHQPSRTSALSADLAAFRNGRGLTLLGFPASLRTPEASLPEHLFAQIGNAREITWRIFALKRKPVFWMGRIILSGRFLRKYRIQTFKTEKLCRKSVILWTNDSEIHQERELGSREKSPLNAQILHALVDLAQNFRNNFRNFSLLASGVSDSG